MTTIVHATIDGKVPPERKDAYLNLCRANGWTPSDEGLAAFSQQILNGLRNEQGYMHWQKAG